MLHTKMYTVTGIPNTKGNCYASSLVQCMRKSLSRVQDSSLLPLFNSIIDGDSSSVHLREGILPGQYQKSLWDALPVGFNDPHELYLELLSLLPKSISEKFSLTYHDGKKTWKMPYLSVDGSNESIEASILSAPEVVCVYRTPSLSTLRDLSFLEIDVVIEGRKRIYSYHISSCICYLHGSNGREALTSVGCTLPTRGIDHYVALVQGDSGWILCDDTHIQSIETELARKTPLSIYLAFYSLVSEE